MHVLFYFLVDFYAVFRDIVFITLLLFF